MLNLRLLRFQSTFIAVTRLPSAQPVGNGPQRFYGVLYSPVSSMSLALKKEVGHRKLLPVLPTNFASARSYGAKFPVTIKTVHDRVMLVLSLYDKIDPAKLTPDAHFINDLGLDSLDHVELILAMEEEFYFEIPDADAERIMTARELIQYIYDKEDVYE